LCGLPATGTAAWHGLVSWALTTLVVFFLVASAVGGIIGGAFSILGSVAGGLGQAATAVAPAVANAASDPFSGIETSINDTLGVRDPAAARVAVVGLVRGAFTSDTSGASSAPSAAPASGSDSGSASSSSAASSTSGAAAAGVQSPMDRASDALARASGLPPDQAKAKLADWKTQYDQAVATAK